MRRAPVLVAAVLVLASGTDASLASQRRNALTCPDGFCDIPWAWDDRAPPAEAPPYPQGFALTIAMPPGPRAQVVAAVRHLDRYAEVADALGRCWDPSDAVGDRHWGAITVRVSFKRDGSVNGSPRVTYVDPLADRSAVPALRSSLLSALGHCAPLPFTASLGQAIAGRIFTIRFVQKGIAI